MTKLGRLEGRSKSVSLRAGLAIAAAATALFAATPACLAYDGPTFRSGLWKFERTLETDGEVTNRLQTSGIPIAREMTRCVNPTSAMKAQFTPHVFGACKPKNFRKTDGGYVFQKFCGSGAPIETQIDAKGDSAYTEINQGNIGKISSKETVIAQRVGDCLHSGG
jgi:hypothetical protein